MITVRECQYDEVEKFRKLEGEYHYMGKSHGAGDMIRLVFEEDGKWIALMTWAAACYALKPRDERIGWNPAMRASRLKLVANNRRFTILDEKGARPNLASRLLGMAIRELPGIWEAKWEYRPLLAETFCDIERTYPPPKAPRSGRLRGVRGRATARRAGRRSARRRASRAMRGTSSSRTTVRRSCS